MSQDDIDDPDDLARRVAEQLTISGDPAFVWGHGGARPGAGRKRKSRRPNVAHRLRPAHARRYPAHVTIPFLKAAGDLRTQLAFKALRKIFVTPKKVTPKKATPKMATPKMATPKMTFQVVQYSVQTDHVHLVVEAADREAFSSGMRSLNIRMALKMNSLLGRKTGKVLRDRYHRRDLFNAKAVRTALRYVLLNGAKHGHIGPTQLDPFSSAFSFDGWHELTEISGQPKATADPKAETTKAVHRVRTAIVVKPWTRLLIEDWRELGLISPFEAERWHRRPSDA